MKSLLNYISSNEKILSLDNYIIENKDKIQYEFSIVFKDKKIIEDEVIDLNTIKDKIKDYNVNDITYIEILDPTKEKYKLYPVMMGGDKDWYYELYNERKIIKDIELDNDKMNYKPLTDILKELKIIL